MKKKPYRSLDKVYLSESFNKPVPLLPRQIILGEADVASNSAIPAKQVNVPTPSTSSSSALPIPPIKGKGKKLKVSNFCLDGKPNIEIKSSDGFEKIKDKPVFNSQWSAFQKEIFNVKKTGAGRGEFSVASLVSGLQPSSAVAREEILCLLDGCIQGTNEKFDVSIPPDTEEYSNVTKLKFEVKELDADGSSVRIGAEGQRATTLIVNSVIKLILKLQNTYNALNRQEKLYVDRLLRKQLNLTNETPPAKPSNETKKNLAKYDKDQHMHELGQNWNLGGFISAIFESEKQDEEGATIRELPSTLIKKEGTMIPSRYSKSRLRSTYFLRTMQEVFNAIEEIAKAGVAKDMSSELTATGSSKSQELKDIVRRMYLPEIPDENKRKKEEEYIDDIVDTIDRNLTKRKILASKAGYLTASQFFDSVNSLKLLSTLRSIQNMFNDAQIIRELFPKDITGLFLVSGDQFSYFPQNIISNYIEIDQISSGGVKVAVKRQQPANDNV